MPKMSKAVARKRINEAMKKLFRVYGECEHLSSKDANHLIKIYNELRPIRNRLK